MRATGNPPTPSQVADQVWDELIAGHTVGGSYGLEFENVRGRVGIIYGNYSRRTVYTYDSVLVAGATYVPTGGTVVMVALLEGISASDFNIMHGTARIFQGNIGDNWEDGIIGSIYCDGTDVGFKNADSVNHDLKLEGITI